MGWICIVSRKAPVVKSGGALAQATQLEAQRKAGKGSDLVEVGKAVEAETDHPAGAPERLDFERKPQDRASIAAATQATASTTVRHGQAQRGAGLVAAFGIPVARP
jgi:hypothetical protein